MNNIEQFHNYSCIKDENTGDQQYECFLALFPFFIHMAINAQKAIKFPIVENAKESQAKSHKAF